MGASDAYNLQRFNGTFRVQRLKHPERKGCLGHPWDASGWGWGAGHALGWVSDKQTAQLEKAPLDAFLFSLVKPPPCSLVAACRRTPGNHAPFSVLLFFSNCFSHELLYLLWDRRFLLIGNNSEAPREFFKMFCESSQKIIGTLRRPFPLPTPHPDLG